MLNVVKQDDASVLRIVYYDNMRVLGDGAARWCAWQILVDGKDCPKGRLSNVVQVNINQDNVHRPRLVYGYCEGLAGQLARS